MKRAYLSIFLILALVGSTAYAQAETRRDGGRDDSRQSRASATGHQFVPAVIHQRTLSPQRIINETERNLNLQVALMQPGVAANTRIASRDRDRDRDGDFDRRRRERGTVVVEVPVYVPVVSDSGYADETLQGYYQPGYEWGASLKGYSVTLTDFVPYLQQYLVNAPAEAQDAFRSGFIAGYGGNAAATFDYAMRQAIRRS